MWIITKIGFFNIVEQDGDRAKGLLTVKARSKEDLNFFNERLPDGLVNIEESLTADYRYRLKARKVDVINVVGFLVAEINYGKTKPAITNWFSERRELYLDVWDVLRAIQYDEEATQER